MLTFFHKYIQGSTAYDYIRIKVTKIDTFCKRKTHSHPLIDNLLSTCRESQWISKCFKNQLYIYNANILHAIKYCKNSAMF